MEKQVESELTPQQYFEKLKLKKQFSTDEELNTLYDNVSILLQKYITTGQITAAKKLMFHLESIEREKEIIRMGINQFIYMDDIDEYIDNVAKNTVKIIELENYIREIPDEIVEKIEQVKDKFDQFYVLFTDYTGREERRVEKERRDKDPILFGTFEKREKNRDRDELMIIDRFYYIGDWIDEYCDLTLDKMVSEMSKANKKIQRRMYIPKTLDELKEQLATIEKTDKGFKVEGQVIEKEIEEPKEQQLSFFQKMKKKIFKDEE